MKRGSVIGVLIGIFLLFAGTVQAAYWAKTYGGGRQ